MKLHYLLQDRSVKEMNRSMTDIYESTSRFLPIFLSTYTFVIRGTFNQHIIDISLLFLSIMRLFVSYLNTQVLSYTVDLICFFIHRFILFF